MNSSPHILVIGAGVIGLTTALCLRRRGFPVTVIADRFAPNVTSNVAGALWEWPPAVCGSHQDRASLERSKQWSAESYDTFAELAEDSTAGAQAGVYFRPAVFYFSQSLQPGQPAWIKMTELKARVPGLELGFRHDSALIRENGVNPEYGVQDAYQYMAPMIDTDAYLPWLKAQLEQAGCTFIRHKVTSKLVECASALKRKFSSKFIVNCSGLGAGDLGDPSVYPIRGALVRVVNGTLPEGNLETAHCISHDESSGMQDIVFIVPRGKDRIVLGGLTEPDEWDENITLENYAPIQEMLDRCLRFLPRLKAAVIDLEEPVRVGLRPGRHQSIRLELDPEDASILHCYGHGGSGVSLSWGCANEVAERISNTAQSLSARSA